ncbi:hypothetical protein KSP39_PZI000707 [Platanthera zijinensis]|uniref:Uncharacterized protein n=1 Tax=Platanthera zijinensis TaxID=2320716 RepID=A0AAP0C070_9ASPA
MFPSSFRFSGGTPCIISSAISVETLLMASSMVGRGREIRLRGLQLNVLAVDARLWGVVFLIRRSRSRGAQAYGGSLGIFQLSTSQRGAKGEVQTVLEITFDH